MYSVVGMDGRVYGPVDVATLQRWCAEGRIGPTSTVIDQQNGQQMFAQSVGALAGCFTLQTPSYNSPPQSYGTVYPRPGYGASGLSPKTKLTAILLTIFLGFFGAHRFYLGHARSGLGMLALLASGCFCGITWAFLALWVFADILLIATDGLVDANGQRLS